MKFANITPDRHIQDSSRGYQEQRRAPGGWTEQQRQYISFAQRSDRLWGPSSLSNGYWVPFSVGVKRQGCVDLSLSNGYWAAFPVGVKRQGCVAPSLSNAYWVPFSVGVKRQGREAHNSPPSSSEVSHPYAQSAVGQLHRFYHATFPKGHLLRTC
jgi:hypothetical protein